MHRSRSPRTFATAPCGTTPAVNVTQWLGNAVTSATAGVPDVNTKNVNNFAVQANSGFVQANVVQLLGGASVGIPGSIGIDWSAIANASAIEFLAQTTIAGFSGTSPGVNVTSWLGTVPNVLSSGNVQADVELWRTVQPNTLVSGRVDSIANQIGTNAIGAGARVAGSLVTTAFAMDYFTSALLDSTASNAIADALGNRANAIETNLTPYQAWRLMASSQGGQLSGAGTTQIGIFGAGVNTTRISAVTDQSGNRSSVTLNL